ncbi:MAG TPA: calcium-binding protein [Rhizomicrobium sp.]|nr:calcium-binding protein [Rhizomicrobium sp.]
MRLRNGFDYKLTMADGNVASGAYMTVNAGALGAAHGLTFDATAELDGHYIVYGGAGADTVTFGGHFSVNDTFDGGAGNNTLTLTNANSLHNLAATTIQNVETLAIGVAPGNSFFMTTNDGNVAAGATLTVDFSSSDSVGAATIHFDGSAETDGHFAFIPPSSSTFFNVSGGALSDSLTMLSHIGSTVFDGLGGDDTMTISASTGDFTFDGGADADTVALTGGGTIGAGSMNLLSVERMTLDDHSWNVATGDNAVGGAGTTLTVDATALTGAHTLTFNGSGETAGSFGLKGGAGDDTLTGGSQADSFLGGIGADTLTGNGGADTFFYTSALQSTGTAHDTIAGFAAGTDKLDLTTVVNQVYGASGSLDSGANFDSQLAALNAMHIGGATEITVTGGTLAGHIILIVDGDGNAQYNAGSDYVFDITGHTGTLATGDFI